MNKRLQDKEIFGDFYSPLKALSYHRPKIYSIGSRTIGKSTGWAIWLLLEWIRKKKQFMYVRRSMDDLHETCQEWFDNAVQILRRSGYEEELKDFYYKGGEYFCNGELCGYAAALSVEEKIKSKNLSGVWYVVFDEFISRRGRYLGGNGSMQEVDAVDSLFTTIDRGVDKAFRNELTWVYLGNAHSFFNPHLIAAGIDTYLRTDTKYLAPKNELYVVELTRSTKATEKIEQSNAFRLQRKTTREAAFFNEAMGSDFVEKIDLPMRGMYNIVFEGTRYGVYTCDKKGIIYISRKPAMGFDIAITTEDHKPNYLLINRWSRAGYTKLLKECYDRGEIRFETMKCKYVVDNYLMYGV